jgi:hypothetical protein
VQSKPGGRMKSRHGPPVRSYAPADNSNDMLCATISICPPEFFNHAFNRQSENFVSPLPVFDCCRAKPPPLTVK